MLDHEQDFQDDVTSQNPRSDLLASGNADAEVEASMSDSDSHVRKKSLRRVSIFDPEPFEFLVDDAGGQSGRRCAFGTVDLSFVPSKSDIVYRVHSLHRQSHGQNCAFNMFLCVKEVAEESDH